MPLVKSVVTKLTVEGVEDAKLRIEEVKIKADELKRDNPAIVPHVDKTKALLEARLLRAGLKAELEKAITQKVDVRTSMFDKLASKLQSASLFGGGAQNVQDASGFLGTTGALAGTPEGLAGITAAAGALLVEITGLVSGFAAATAGVGAFGLLALPTFDKIKTAYTAISAAQKTYNNAEALYKESPTKTNATAAANALLKLKAAQESMGPSTARAVGGIHDLIGTFDKMAQAFQPTVMKVFNDGLKIANSLLPDLKPLATAAGTAIDGLLKQLGKFVNSAGFKSWLASFGKLVGPSVTAIGQGIGKVTVSLGKLLTVMSAHDVVHALNIAFDTLNGTIIGIRWAVDIAMKAWSIFEHTILGTFRLIIDGAAKAFGFLPVIGPELRKAQAAFNNWANGIEGALAGITATAGITSSSLAGVANAAINAFSKAKGPGSLTGIGSATPHASGGPAGGLILVGERGPELLRVPRNSYVYNHHETTSMLSGRSGGNHYTIVQNIPAAVDRVAVGRATVEAIRAFEKTSGAGWRASH
jgi:hypothetical protein